jgi:hypothetical protein
MTLADVDYLESREKPAKALHALLLIFIRNLDERHPSLAKLARRQAPFYLRTDIAQNRSSSHMNAS